MTSTLPIKVESDSELILFSHSILFSITCTLVTGGIMMNIKQW